MNKILLFLLYIFIMGCAAQKIYHNSNPEANLDRDTNLCQMYSTGNSPMPSPPPAVPTYQTTGSGMITGTPGAPIFYNYTQTTQPDPYYNMQQNLNHMSNTFAALARQQKLFDMCMRNLGWIEVEEGVDTGYRTQGENNKRYSECVKEHAEFLPKQFTYKTPQELITDLEKICRERTDGGFVKNIAAYYAHQKIKN